MSMKANKDIWSKRLLLMGVYLICFLMTGCRMDQETEQTSSPDPHVDLETTIPLNDIHAAEVTPNNIQDQSDLELIFVVDDLHSLLDEDCEDTCIWGLTPGKANMDNVYRALSEMGIISYCTEYPIDDTNQTLRIVCGSHLIFKIDNNDSLLLVGIAPTDVFLSDVMDIFGVPERVLVFDSGLPEYPETWMWLPYDEYHLIINLLPAFATSYDANEDTVVADVIIFSPNEYSEHLAIYSDYTQPWEGYGVYFIQDN